MELTDEQKRYFGVNNVVEYWTHVVQYYGIELITTSSNTMSLMSEENWNRNYVKRAHYYGLPQQVMKKIIEDFNTETQKNEFTVITIG